MQSYENFIRDVSLAVEDQINQLAKIVPPDQSLDFNKTIEKMWSYFLFDNDNEIKSLSHMIFARDDQNLNIYANTNKSYPELKKKMDEGKLWFNPNNFYLKTDYQLELDFYWYLQKQFNANYLSICELETIGEKLYFTSKFLNLSDMTEFKDITEVIRNTNDGQLIFNKIISIEDKSKILENIPGILELFSSRINCNWSAIELKTLNDLHTKFLDMVLTFNTEADKANRFDVELDDKIKHKLVLELIALNGRKVSETSSSNSPEFKIVSITDKVRLLQSKNIPLFQCMIELESQSLWSTSIDGDSILKKELEDIINGARNGNPEESSGFMGLYIMFRVKLDFPNILTDEQIITNITTTTKEFKKRNLMP